MPERMLSPIRIAKSLIFSLDPRRREERLRVRRALEWGDSLLQQVRQERLDGIDTRTDEELDRELEEAISNLNQPQSSSH